MKKYLLSLFAIALAIGFSAFTTNSKTLFNYGILSTGSDGGGTFYNVEAFGTTRTSCATQTGTDCSFDYTSSGQTKIYTSDVNISNLQTDKVYQ